MLRTFSTQSVPFRVRNTVSLLKDGFAQELLDLWDSRDMRGMTYTGYVYSKPVGFVLLENNSAELRTIRGFWIREDFRGKGIGSSLLEQVLRDYEHLPVDIKVNITPGAERFYEQHGFEIVGYRDDFKMNIGLWKSLVPKRQYEKNIIQH